jgi:RNA polymerase sigma-70 factor, ECF subfamily
MTDFVDPGHFEEMLAATRRTPEEELAPPSGPQRFAHVFQSHADFVWRALRRLGLSAADAEDALQDVFLVVYRRLDQYEERGKIRGWLFAISRQVVSHYHRGAARSERRLQAIAQDDAGANEDPFTAAARRESVAIVRALLAELSEPQATVFWLAEVEEMTVPEISTALGINLNTAYGRLRVARQRFEQMLRERSGELA